MKILTITDPKFHAALKEFKTCKALLDELTRIGRAPDSIGTQESGIEIRASRQPDRSFNITISIDGKHISRDNKTPATYNYQPKRR